METSMPVISSIGVRQHIEVLGSVMVLFLEQGSGGITASIFLKGPLTQAQYTEPKARQEDLSRTEESTQHQF